MLVAALEDSVKFINREGDFWFGNEYQGCFLVSDRKNNHAFIGVINPDLLKTKTPDDRLIRVVTNWVSYENKPTLTVFNLHKAFDLLNIESDYAGINIKRKFKSNSYGYIGYIKNNIKFEFRFLPNQVLASCVNDTLVEYFKDLSWIKKTNFETINKIYKYIGEIPTSLTIINSELGKVKTLVMRYDKFNFNNPVKPIPVKVISYIHHIMGLIGVEPKPYSVTVNAIQFRIYNNKVSVKLPGRSSIIIHRPTDNQAGIDAIFSLLDDLDIELFLNKLELYKLKKI